LASVWVSDVVWRQLNPSAGRLSRRTTRRLWAVLLPVLLVAVIGGSAWTSGLVIPRLTWYRTSNDWLTTTPDGDVRLNIVVLNAGAFSVTLLDAGPHGPGIGRVGLEGVDLPLTLGPHNGVGVTFVARITDCSLLPAGDWPLDAVVSRPWGPMTVPIAAEDFSRPAQLAIMDAACHR
jgi:hypothetical protein